MNDNPQTESPMFKTKTVDEIKADIKAAFEMLQEMAKTPVYTVSQKEFNSMSKTEQHYALQIAENYPWRVKIEGELL